MKWQPLLLLAIAGFLVGGVVALWRNDSKIGAVVLGIIAAAFATGGVVWLL